MELGPVQIWACSVAMEVVPASEVTWCQATEEEEARSLDLLPGAMLIMVVRCSLSRMAVRTDQEACLQAVLTSSLKRSQAAVCGAMLEVTLEVTSMALTQT